MKPVRCLQLIKKKNSRHIERGRDEVRVLDCARNFNVLFADFVMKIKRTIVAPMEAASPDLEKQGFLAVVFIYREYSAQRDNSRTEQ
ncbi:hypothetical protein [Flavobacterium sp. GNP001]